MNSSRSGLSGDRHLSHLDDLGPHEFVTLSLQELRPHPSYARHNLSVQPFKLAALEEQGEVAFSTPILITQDKFIIDGYTRLELAKRKGLRALNCIECNLTSEEALQELIRRNSRSHGWPDFIRIELALDLESNFQVRALLNRQAGGRLKGLSKLTEAEKVNSRTEVARAVHVSVGNVHKVKYILTHACGPLQEAARTGEISINLAEKWSHEAAPKQREYLRLSRIQRGIKKKARHLVSAEVVRTAPSNRDEQVFRLSDLVTLVNRFTSTAPEATEEIDAIEVKLVDGPGRAIFITGDLFRVLAPQQEVLVR
jgi:hypothetical protein